MNIHNALNEISEIAEKVIAGMTEASAEDLRLDPRACPKLWVSESAVAIRTSHRRNMEYYGGFEYVDKEYVHPIGDYVFYLRDDDRVAEAIEYFLENSSEI